MGAYPPCDFPLGMETCGGVPPSMRHPITMHPFTIIINTINILTAIINNVIGIIVGIILIIITKWLRAEIQGVHPGQETSLCLPLGPLPAPPRHPPPPPRAPPPPPHGAWPPVLATPRAPPSPGRPSTLSTWRPASWGLTVEPRAFYQSFLCKLLIRMCFLESSAAFPQYSFLSDHCNAATFYHSNIATL